MWNTNKINNYKYYIHAKLFYFNILYKNIKQMKISNQQDFFFFNKRH